MGTWCPKIFPYSTHFFPLSWMNFTPSFSSNFQHLPHSSFLAKDLPSYLTENMEVIRSEHSLCPTTKLPIHQYLGQYNHHRWTVHVAIELKVNISIYILDAIPSHLLKDFTPATVPSLSLIINLSLYTPPFPLTYKHAICPPKNKKNSNTSCPSSHSPITLLSLIEILETTSLWLSILTVFNSSSISSWTHCTKTVLVKVANDLHITKSNSLFLHLSFDYPWFFPYLRGRKPFPLRIWKTLLHCLFYMGYPRAWMLVLLSIYIYSLGLYLVS